jgi:hypothetical protein
MHYINTFHVAITVTIARSICNNKTKNTSNHNVFFFVSVYVYCPLLIVNNNYLSLITINIQE